MFNNKRNEQKNKFNYLMILQIFFKLTMKVDDTKLYSERLEEHRTSATANSNGRHRETASS
jgi:hypothetical protein